MAAPTWKVTNSSLNLDCKFVDVDKIFVAFSTKVSLSEAFLIGFGSYAQMLSSFAPSYGA